MDIMRLPPIAYRILTGSWLPPVDQDADLDRREFHLLQSQHCSFWRDEIPECLVFSAFVKPPAD